MSATNAATSKTAAAAAEGRGIAASGGVIVAETVVVVDGPEGIGVPAADVRIVCRGAGHPGAIERVAGAGGYAVMGQATLVIGGVERPEIVISGGRRAAFDNIATPIVWVIEIGIIPAVPDVVVIPDHIGIAKSQAHAEAGAVEGAIAKTIVGCAKAITEPGAIAIACAIDGGGSIISIGGIVVVKIRPAIVILGFHLDILVIGGGGYIVGAITLAGRIHVRAVLGIFGGGAAAHPDGGGNRKKGKGI